MTEQQEHSALLLNSAQVLALIRWLWCKTLPLFFLPLPHIFFISSSLKHTCLFFMSRRTPRLFPFSLSKEFAYGAGTLQSGGKSYHSSSGKNLRRCLSWALLQKTPLIPLTLWPPHDSLVKEGGEKVLKEVGKKGKSNFCRLMHQCGFFTWQLGSLSDLLSCNKIK